MTNEDNTPWEEPEPDMKYLRKVKAIAARYYYKRDDTQFMQEQRVHAKLYNEAGYGNALDYFKKEIYRKKIERKNLNEVGREMFMRDGTKKSFGEVVRFFEVSYAFADLDIEAGVFDESRPVFEKELKNFFSLCWEIKKLKELKEEAGPEVETRLPDSAETLLGEIIRDKYLKPKGITDFDTVKVLLRGKKGEELAYALKALEHESYLDNRRYKSGKFSAFHRDFLDKLGVIGNSEANQKAYDIKDYTYYHENRGPLTRRETKEKAGIEHALDRIPVS